MPGLEPLQFVKNWTTNTRTRTENWDEVANKTSSWGQKVLNYLKQLGLDINGSSYVYNGDGRATQTTAIIPRIAALEGTINGLGARNLGLSLAATNTVALVSAAGTALSATNTGKVTFNSTASPGVIVTRDIIAPVSLVLTGCHWGNDTYGDLTDYPLWIMMLDNGTDAVLGVGARGGRVSVPAADTDTAVGNITTFDKVLVSAACAAEYNVTYLGWIKANFDDTGNPGGENYWTIQSGTGDVNVGTFPNYYEGEVRF